MKIIIVDDERKARENLYGKMKQIPQITEIRAFSGAQPALDWANRHPVDVAFLDMEMPGMTGIETAKKLKRVNPRLNIVFIATHDAFALDAFKVSASDYILKPAQVEDIYKALDNLRYPAAGDDDGLLPRRLTAPFFHRADLGFTYDSAENIKILETAADKLPSAEHHILDELIRAGLYFENAEPGAAHRLILAASGKIKATCTPETRFAAFILAAAIMDALNLRKEARLALRNAESVITKNGAYYLNAAFRAFSCRLKLADGDMDAARGWLKQDAETLRDAPLSRDLYKHLTTARAHIVTGDYGAAIRFLQRLREMSGIYRTPRDEAEANILLAIACWRKPRGVKNEAFAPLERAVAISREYGCAQLFANEGAELATLLHRLHKRIVQKGFTSTVAAVDVKTLYFMVLARAKVARGLTGGRTTEKLRFTERQKTVMRHLNEGFTHREIGEKMGLKTSAIKSHLMLIYKKLDVSSGVDAIIKIRELGVLDG